ncbi:hypothetical protein BOX15_Mlig000972g1, partial [Macrostomum lignano]
PVSGCDVTWAVSQPRASSQQPPSSETPEMKKLRRQLSGLAKRRHAPSLSALSETDAGDSAVFQHQQQLHHQQQHYPRSASAISPSSDSAGSLAPEERARSRTCTDLEQIYAMPSGAAVSPALYSDGDGAASSHALVDGPHYACSNLALQQQQLRQPHQCQPHHQQQQQLVVNSAGHAQLLQHQQPHLAADEQQRQLHYACAAVMQNGGAAVKFRRHQQQPGQRLAQPHHNHHNGSGGDAASKRLSLPAPAHYWVQQNGGRSASPACGSGGGGGSPTPLVADLLALSKRDRRSSLADIGFGKITSYRKLDKLGQGTYATVYRGKSLLTDSLVALKEIRLEHDEGAPCTAIREVSLLRDLKHANIVTLHDIIHTDKSLTLVFEYLDKDLKQCLEECSGLLHEGNVRLYLYQLLRGLEYCHRRRYLHRDLKPQNILLNQRGELKLADFGLARANSVPSKTYSNEVCTLWYRPADVLLGNTEYSTHIDLWGVGAIFFEMITGRPMFPGSTVEEQLQLIFRTLGSPTEESWPGSESNQQLQAYNFPHWLGMDLKSVAPRLSPTGQDLMRQLLQYQANRRISAEKAKLHPYFMQFMPAILNDLPDTSSIFEIPGVCLYTNPVPHCRAPAGCSGAVLPDKRRQSMLF